VLRSSLLRAARFAALIALPLGSTRAVDDELLLTHVAGVVRDAEARPIAGALVEIKSLEIIGEGDYELRPGGPGNGRGVSDEKGRYRASFYAKPGGAYALNRISAHARGFVRANVVYSGSKPVVSPGGALEIPLDLSKGEVLAGVVGSPLRLKDRLEGRSSAHAIRVRGDAFTLNELTGPDRAFEVWVPTGEYSVAWVRGGEEVVTLEHVPSGSRGLKLAKSEPPCSADLAGRAFDALWDDMALHYSYFDLKKIDWLALKEKYRPSAVGAGTLPAFVDVLGELLGELGDGHVWFTEPDDAMVAFRHAPRNANANFRAVAATLVAPRPVGDDFAAIGLTKGDGFAAILVTRQSKATPESVDELVTFIRSQAKAPGFLVDLRGANGGNELLARKIASEFCARPTVYAKSKFRNGPRPTDFGPPRDRVLGASASPYQKPVVCILGPGCVSSGEGFAKMMTCQPHVTTVGSATRGSSGNPQPFTLPGLPVTVMYSRWFDMLPDGTPVEGRGIIPNILVDLPESAYLKDDPSWSRALDVLRQKVKAAEQRSPQKD
jgi:carboxyl-terminal processing protease